MGATRFRSRSRLFGLLDDVVTHLGEHEFDNRVATGAAMETAAAVRYARDQIALARRQLLAST